MFEWKKIDRKSTRLNSSHLGISYADFCLKKNKRLQIRTLTYPVAPLDSRRFRGPPSRLYVLSTAYNSARARKPSPLWTPGASFFNDTATTEIYALSLHDALPIYWEIHGTFLAKAGEYPGRWFDEKFAKKDGEGDLKPERLWEAKRAEDIRAKCLGKPGVVTEESK